MGHHLLSLQLFGLPHGDHVRQKKWLSQKILSLLEGRRDLQAAKAKLKSSWAQAASGGWHRSQVPGPQSHSVKYSVDTVNENWGSGSYGHIPAAQGASLAILGLGWLPVRAL